MYNVGNFKNKSLSSHQIAFTVSDLQDAAPFLGIHVSRLYLVFSVIWQKHMKWKLQKQFAHKYKEKKVLKVHAVIINGHEHL